MARALASAVWLSSESRARASTAAEAYCCVEGPPTCTNALGTARSRRLREGEGCRRMCGREGCRESAVDGRRQLEARHGEAR